MRQGSNGRRRMEWYFGGLCANYGNLWRLLWRNQREKYIEFLITIAITFSPRCSPRDHIWQTESVNEVTVFVTTSIRWALIPQIVSIKYSTFLSKMPELEGKRWFHKNNRHCNRLILVNQDSSLGALLIPDTGTCRHDFISGENAFWAGKYWFQRDSIEVLSHDFILYSNQSHNTVYRIEYYKRFTHTHYRTLSNRLIPFFLRHNDGLLFAIEKLPVRTCVIKYSP